MVNLVDQFVDATTFTHNGVDEYRLDVAEDGLPDYKITAEHTPSLVAEKLGMWIGNAVTADAIQHGWLPDMAGLHLEIDLRLGLVGSEISLGRSGSDQKLSLRSPSNLLRQTGMITSQNPHFKTFKKAMLELNKGTGELNEEAPIIPVENEHPLWGCLALAAVRKHVQSLEPIINR